MHRVRAFLCSSLLDCCYPPLSLARPSELTLVEDLQRFEAALAQHVTTLRSNWNRTGVLTLCILIASTVLAIVFCIYVGTVGLLFLIVPLAGLLVAPPPPVPTAKYAYMRAFLLVTQRAA